MMNKKYILISNIPERNIDGLIFGISKIVKNKSVELSPVTDEEEIIQFDEAKKFGFIYSVVGTPAGYFDIIKLNGKEIRQMTPTIISIDETFNQIYQVYKTSFLEYFSDGTLDLSDLLNKAELPNNFNFNDLSFAQTLYFLCYQFQCEDGKIIEDLILNNNGINQKGFTTFSYLISSFFPSLKTVYLIGNDVNLSSSNTVIPRTVEVFIYDFKVQLIARQTDLTPQAVNGIMIANEKLQNCSISYIIDQIKKNVKMIEEQFYVSSEAYKLHHLQDNSPIEQT